MIGREREIKELNKLYEKNKAELIAVYGRRRVGKTYLIDETFANRLTFRYAALSPADREAKGLLSAQLEHFYNSLDLYGMEKTDKPKSWQQNTTEQTVVTWRGYAFENVCFNHIDQIKDALGISGVITTSSAWSKRDDDEQGVQIDLLLNRNDNVINMCEIKFYSGDFVVNKSYYNTLLHRQEVLAKEVSRKKVVHNTLITTNGIKRNEYSSIFTNVVTLDDLFRENR